MTERPEVTPPAADEGEDLVPVSVRLGEVVPPEDPEDWTKPLTWVAAAGMLLGPLAGVAWFVVTPPDARGPSPGTWLLAAAVAAGATLTGSTQQSRVRAWTSTLATALFEALVVIIIGAAFAGERQIVEASPPLAHAFGAGVAGLLGAVASSPVAAAVAPRPRWLLRLAVPGAVGVGVALLVVPLVFGAPIR
jgi:hypothetical protein